MNVIEQLTDDLVNSLFKETFNEELVREKINVLLRTTCMKQVKKCEEAYMEATQDHVSPSNTLSLYRCVTDRIDGSRIY